MTALGLAVAVPAVLAYNWLQRRNKAIAEDLSAFSNDVLGYMMSGGTVKPINARAGTAATAGSTASNKPAVSTTKPATTTTAGQVGGVQPKA
jgi:biopolymer transport protein ExbB